MFGKNPCTKLHFLLHDTLICQIRCFFNPPPPKKKGKQNTFVCLYGWLIFLKTKGLLRKTTVSFTSWYLKTLKKRCYMTRFVRLWQTSLIVPCSVPFTDRVPVTCMLKMNDIYFQSTQLCHKWIQHLQKPLKPSKNHQNWLIISWFENIVSTRTPWDKNGPPWGDPGVEKFGPLHFPTVYTQMNQNMQ